MQGQTGAMELVDRVRAQLPTAVEKRMFGGTGFMVDGALACSVSARGLLVRVGAEHQADLLAADGVEPMVKGGRTSRGWVHVDAARRRRRRRAARVARPRASRPRAPRSARRRDEVDELLDPAEQLGLEVGVGADRRRGSAARPARGRPGSSAASRGARAMPTFHDVPRGITGQASIPSALRLHRLPDVDVRVADDQHVRGVRLHLRAPPRRPATPWCPARGGRRARPSGAPARGRTSRTAPARSSTPSSISTTTPSTRRSSPHTFSTSSASCLPSTKIRDPLATRARCPVTARDPLAVRADAARARSSSASASRVGQSA